MSSQRHQLIADDKIKIGIDSVADAVKLDPDLVYDKRVVTSLLETLRYKRASRAVTLS